MKTRLAVFWYTIRSGYWFIPSLMLAGAIALSFVTISIDGILDSQWIKSMSLVFVNKPEGARLLLSTVAGSMITVGALVFSLTLVVLSLTSSQFGPRLLRNFMRDTSNQIVLGVFIATFVYCLLVLRTIHSGEESDFVPYISIIVSVLLTIVSLGVLIYFIHHIAESIQSANVIARVNDDLESVINRLFPKNVKSLLGHIDWWKASRGIPPNFDWEAYPIKINNSGYIRAIDKEGLIGTATKKDLILRVEYRPGEFVVKKNLIVSAWPKEGVDENLSNKINGFFVLGTERTHEQDAEFPVEQLSEIAVRALSPGINDPFTAVRCINQLGAALCEIAERPVPQRYYYDSDNKLRLVTKAVSFPGMIDTAFNQIRQYGRTSAAVTIRLLEMIAVIAARVSREEDREALLRHAAMVERGSRQGLPEELDRKDAQERYQAVLKILAKR